MRDGVWLFVRDAVRGMLFDRDPVRVRVAGRVALCDGILVRLAERDAGMVRDDDATGEMEAAADSVDDALSESLTDGVALVVAAGEVDAEAGLRLLVLVLEEVNDGVGVRDPVAVGTGVPPSSETVRYTRDGCSG